MSIMRHISGHTKKSSTIAVQVLYLVTKTLAQQLVEFLFVC
jgi:hypothetical protein